MNRTSISSFEMDKSKAYSYISNSQIGAAHILKVKSSWLI